MLEPTGKTKDGYVEVVDRTTGGILWVGANDVATVNSWRAQGANVNASAMAVPGPEAVEESNVEAEVETSATASPELDDEAPATVHSNVETSAVESPAKAPARRKRD